jgi:hypothetical protein
MKFAVHRKRLTFLFVLSALLGFGHATTLAQERTLPTAQKFDEFGDVYPTEMAARLDNFAVALQQEPNARGFLIVYRSHRDLPGLSGRHLIWMRGYLVNRRMIVPDRIAIVDGGEAPCLTHELWLVPVGATPTPRTDAYSRGLDDAGAAHKFDEYFWDAPSALPESFSIEYGDTFEGFALALRLEPRALAYIIVYAEYRVVRTKDVDQRGRAKIVREVWIDPPGTAARKLKETKELLVKKQGISPARVRLVNGGYRRWRHIELWIVPPGENPPVPTPNAFPQRRASRRK